MAAISKKSADGRGGARPNSGGRRQGAGRKPKPLTEFQQAIVDRIDDAQYAFNLFVTTMKDVAQPLNLRLECSAEVMNRVLGKPRQQIDQKQSGGLTVRVEFVRRDPDPARAAPVASGDPGVDPSLQRRRLWEALREVGTGDPAAN